MLVAVPPIKRLGHGPTTERVSMYEGRSKGLITSTGFVTSAFHNDQKNGPQAAVSRFDSMAYHDRSRGRIVGTRILPVPQWAYNLSARMRLKVRGSLRDIPGNRWI